MIDLATVYSNVSGSFPDVTAQNATGAGLTDGTEFIKAGLDNGPEFGFMQSMMAYGAGGANAPTGTMGVPNGVSDGEGVNQIIEAMQRGFGIGPGKLTGWFLNDDPSVTLDRVLLLQGQGVLVATYPDLTAEVYVGDGNNAAAQAVGAAFYKSSTADGLNPIDGGAFLILPESRGYALRGLDLAASVDPDGATRLLGDNQVDKFQRWQLGALGDPVGARNYFAITDNRDTQPVTQAAVNDAILRLNTAGQGLGIRDIVAVDDGTNGTPRTGPETRMSNLSIQFGITY